MCDIFPEFKKCCVCFSLRLGMIIMAIISIVNGCVFLLIVIKVPKTTITDLLLLKNITISYGIKGPLDALNYIDTYIPAAVLAMGGLFAACGLVLLLATLMASEGIVQAFVYSQFLNVVVGFLLVGAVTYSCATTPATCLLKGLDWLSTAGVVLGFTAYLIVWVYFISIANSWALNGDGNK